jgi:raffinose/stachyose/melibiose transport system substrate-binding protein
MKLKRFNRLWLAGLAVGVLLLTAACATTDTTDEPADTGGEPADTGGEPADTGGEADEVVELTFWNIVISDTFTSWWEEYVAEWNAANPNVQVTYETFETEAYKSRIAAAVIAGTAPDLFYQIPGPETAAWFDEGKLLPLEGVLDTDRFLPGAQEGCSDSGQMVCVPMYLAPSFIYYNTEQFADAGIDRQDWADPMQPTWDEFLAAGEALKAAGHIPIALGNADNWPGLFYFWAIQNRYGGVDELFNAVEGVGSYTDPSFIKAGELVQQLETNGYFPDGFNGIGGDQTFTIFTQGNGAMIFQGPWVNGIISAEAPEGFEYDFFHFPSFADGDPNAQTDLMSGFDALWINAELPHTQEVADFLEGFYDPDTALDFMLATENISSIVGVAEAAAAEGSDPQLSALTEASGFAANFYPWWDWTLQPAVTEQMMSTGQALFISELTPMEFSEGMEGQR